MAIQTSKRQASEEFVLAYGDAMVQWANIEVNLAVWFRRITLMPMPETAQAIFFSARSFQGRSDMFAAALDHVPAESQDLAFLRDAHLKAVAYSNVRNEIAHGFAHPGSDSLAKSVDWNNPGAIALSELRNVAVNFKKLAVMLIDSHEAMKPTSPPEQLAELHERLRLLPNEACSSEPSRNQQGRERQRQAALRNKSKPQ
jgi:hypothetical protein